MTRIALSENQIQRSRFKKVLRTKLMHVNLLAIAERVPRKVSDDARDAMPNELRGRFLENDQTK